MAGLAAWRFEGPAGAARAAEVLSGLVEAGRLDLRDAATAVWDPGQGRPRTQQLLADAPGSLDGGFWGLLFGVVFFVPLLGAAVGAPTGATAGALADVGIDDGFINRLRDQVTPGTSALLALGSGSDLERLHDGLAARLRSEHISTDLTADQAGALRAVFGG